MADQVFMEIREETLIAWCLLFFGYLGFSSVLQWYFYSRSKQEPSSCMWKIQNTRLENIGDKNSWIPFLRNKKTFIPNQALYATINLVFAASFLAITVEFTFREQNRVSLSEHIWSDLFVVDLFIGFFLSFLVQSILEYYWHRIMHLPFFYKHMHKIHHAKKAPEPFDDMLIHPLEGFGYYFIFYSPFFLVPQHISSMVLYIVLLGIAGIMDHSGIKFRIPYIYDTVDHDLHHLKTNVNFGFPCNFMDILHGTSSHS